MLNNFMRRLTLRSAVFTAIFSGLLFLSLALVATAQNNPKNIRFTLNDNLKSYSWDSIVTGHKNTILLLGENRGKHKNRINSAENYATINLFSVDISGELLWKFQVKQFSNFAVNRITKTGENHYCLSFVEEKKSGNRFRMLNISGSGKVVSEFGYDFAFPKITQRIEEKEYIPVLGNSDGSCTILLPISIQDKSALKLLKISITGKVTVDKNIDTYNSSTFIAASINDNDFILSDSNVSKIDLVKDILSGNKKENYLKNGKVHLRLITLNADRINEKLIYKSDEPGETITDLIYDEGFIISGGLASIGRSNVPVVIKRNVKGKMFWKYSHPPGEGLGYGTLVVTQYDKPSNRVLLAYSNKNSQLEINAINFKSGDKIFEEKLKPVGNLENFVILNPRSILLSYLTFDGVIISEIDLHSK